MKGRDNPIMIREIQIMTAIYKNISLPAHQVSKLRGFFADLDPSDDYLHNHSLNGSDLYRYPMIQYKSLHGVPTIIACEEGIGSMYPWITKTKTLNIGGNLYHHLQKEIRIQDVLIGDSSRHISYHFLTPWMALNQKNFAVYQTLGSEEQNALLSRTLIGNILAICKGFSVTIDNQLEVSHDLRQVSVRYKGNQMIGFLGDFSVNCMLPSLCGIGKGVSLGFGTLNYS